MVVPHLVLTSPVPAAAPGEIQRRHHPDSGRSVSSSLPAPVSYDAGGRR